jgi:hypothetical protein
MLGINEVFINYDRYLVLSNRKNIFNRKHSFKIITFITGLFSFLLFVPNLFVYQISLDPNQTDSYYLILERNSQIGENYLFTLYLLIILAASNNFSTLFLIITSAKLTLQARNFSRKITILQTNHNQTAKTRQNIRSKKLEMNILKLV